MGEHDALSFCPHIGIASGLVTVGYVGTPLKYSCSVFGTPVTYANRCTSVKPEIKDMVSSSIVFPADEWQNRNFEQVIPCQKIKLSDGKIQEMPQSWQLLEPRTVELRNIGDFQIREIVNSIVSFPMQTMEERAKEALKQLGENGLYRPSKTNKL